MYRFTVACLSFLLACLFTTAAGPVISQSLPDHPDDLPVRKTKPHPVVRRMIVHPEEAPSLELGTTNEHPPIFVREQILNYKQWLAHHNAALLDLIKTILKQNSSDIATYLQTEKGESDFQIADRRTRFIADWTTKNVH